MPHDSSTPPSSPPRASDDEAVRACAREAAVQHGGFGNDGTVEVGVTAIRRWLSHCASRPPAPALTGAALPEYPAWAPGPWDYDEDPKTFGDNNRYWITDANGFALVSMSRNVDYKLWANVRDFILARVNARLPAPAAAPGVTLFCDENGRCLSRGPIFRREFAVGQDVIENGREYVVISDKPDGANRIVVLRASAPIAMSEADRACLYCGGPYRVIERDNGNGTVNPYEIVRDCKDECPLFAYYPTVEAAQFALAAVRHYADSAPAAPVAPDMSPEDAARLATIRKGIVNLRPYLPEFAWSCNAVDFLLVLLTEAHARLAAARKELESEKFMRGLDNVVMERLRAQAGATGTVELTKEERERICDDYGMPASAIADDVLAVINRRTRPAASAGDEKRDQEEVVGVLWAGGKFCVPCWLRTETFEAIRDMGDRLARQDTGSCMKCGRDVADVFDAMLRG